MNRWWKSLLARLRRWRRFPHQSPWTDRQLQRMGSAVDQAKIRSHRRKAVRRRTLGGEI